MDDEDFHAIGGIVILLLIVSAAWLFWPENLSVKDAVLSVEQKFQGCDRDRLKDLTMCFHSPGCTLNVDEMKERGELLKACR